MPCGAQGQLTRHDVWHGTEPWPACPALPAVQDVPENVKEARAWIENYKVPSLPAGFLARFACLFVLVQLKV